MLHLAKDQVPQNWRVTVPFARPDVATALNVPAGGWPAFLGSDRHVIPGGGAFGMRPGGGWRQQFNMARRFLLPMNAASLLACDYALIAVGAGPFGGWMNARHVAAVFEKARLASVRDEESYDYLRKAGVRRSDLAVSADWVLGLTHEDIPGDVRERTSPLLRAADRNARRIGVHLSAPPETPLYRTIHEAVIAFAKRHPRVTISLLIDHPHESSQQLRAARSLVHHLGSQAELHQFTDHWSLACLISELEGLITNKLHVAITSLALGKAAVSVAKHPKNHRLYRQIGRPDWSLDLSGSSATQILKLMEAALIEHGPSFTMPATVRAMAMTNRVDLRRFLSV